MFLLSVSDLFEKDINYFYDNFRGYAAINNILVCGRVDLKQCYIRGKQEQYAFISLQVLTQS